MYNLRTFQELYNSRTFQGKLCIIQGPFKDPHTISKKIIQ